MDLVGLPLSEAIACLKDANYSYTISKTIPTRDYFKVDDDQLYVVRQHVQEANTYFLMTAAKMRKEVC